MKKIYLIITLCFLTAFLCACSPAGAISTYTMAIEDMPENFDPQVAQKDSEIMVLTNTFDGLFEYRNGEIVPNVAQDYTVSSDGLTYTFTMRSDSYFYLDSSTQIPVTAYDFAFGINRVLDPSTNSPYYSQFANMESVYAKDENTLVIKLKSQDSSLLQKLCMPAAYPCNEEFFHSTNGAYGLSVKTILSNGPFTINYIADKNSYITIIRVAEMKNGIDRIRISKYTGESTLEDMYNADEISGFMTQDETVSVAGTSYVFENSGIYLSFNLDDEIFKNENVRRAFGYYCYALENTDANKDALTVLNGIFNHSLTYQGSAVADSINPAVPSYMNYSSGKEILNQAYGEMGVSKLENLTVLIPSDSRYSVIFEHINQLWQKELGVYLSLEFLPSNEIANRISSGDYQLAFTAVTPSSNDAVSLLTPFKDYDSALSGYISQALKTSNPKEYLSYLEKGQNIVLERAFLVPMCSTNTTYYHKSYFNNVDINVFGTIVNLKYATVQ